MREKKETYAVLTPKNDSAKKRMEYHGNKWIFRGEVDTLKFVKGEGPWLVLISRDGKKCIHVHKKNDPDFSAYLL